MRLFGQWGAEFPRNWRPETGINSAVSQCWITHWSGIILVNNLLSLVFLPPVSLPVSILVGLSTWRQTLYWSGKPPTLFLPCYITVVIKSWYRQSQWIQWLPVLWLYIITVMNLHCDCCSDKVFTLTDVSSEYNGCQNSDIFAPVMTV